MSSEVKGFFRYNFIVSYVFFVVAVLAILGFDTGIFVSLVLQDVSVRDVSYSLGVVVAACLSYLATESGRHNKRNEITEKNLASLRDVTGEFCHKIGVVKHLLAKAERKRSLIKKEQSDQVNISHSLNYRKGGDLKRLEGEFEEIKSELEDSINSSVVNWKVLNICFVTCFKGEGGSSLYPKIGNNVDRLGGVVPILSDNDFAKIKGATKNIDTRVVMDYMSIKIAKGHNGIYKDNWYKGKLLSVVLMLVMLAGFYAGYIGGRGSALGEEDFLFFASYFGYIDYLSDGGSLKGGVYGEEVIQLLKEWLPIKYP